MDILNIAHPKVRRPRPALPPLTVVRLYLITYDDISCDPFPANANFTEDTHLPRKLANNRSCHNIHSTFHSRFGKGNIVETKLSGDFHGDASFCVIG